jgi:acetoin utilization deacetylase AcuC-like enzyme
MRIITDEHCTGYFHPGHPERPQRIEDCAARLRRQGDMPISWHAPLACDDAQILRAHTPEHLARFQEAEPFDTDTPYFPGILDYARASAGAALAALQAARAGESSLSLMRPPGHHATARRAMGFCYLNNIAIAALEALATGVKSIAIFDFDVHHGNGTEAILKGRPSVWFMSVHQHPCYPGTGTRNVSDNCFNYPAPPQTNRADYRELLESAIERIEAIDPRMIGVSAGFDAFARDPLAQQKLELEDFHWLGSRLRKLGIPLFNVLEGGYSVELPELLMAYLKGLEGK